MDNKKNKIVVTLSFDEFLSDKRVKYSNRMTVRLTPEQSSIIYRVADKLAIEPSVYARCVLLADAAKYIKGDR